jgi:hypothetical protein
MKTTFYLIIICFVLSQGCFSQTVKNTEVRIHELFVPYYDVLLEPILKNKLVNTENIVFTINLQVDSLYTLIPKQYFKYSEYYIENSKTYTTRDITFWIYKDSVNIYAQLYTDSAIFVPLKLELKINEIFNKNNFREIAFDEKEIQTDIGMGALGSFEWSIFYWNFHKTYYYLFRMLDEPNFGLELCNESRKRDICLRRKELMEKIFNELKRLSPLLELESFHNYPTYR